MTDDRPSDDLQAIVPNLHWHYSGVTATNRMTAPRLARILPVAWLGPDAPDGIDMLSFGDLMRLRFAGRPIVWHARRNNEMMVGLALKWLGWPFRLVFTSAAQRHHTWITRFLIGQMDDVMAASDAAASYLQRPAKVILHGVDTELYSPPRNREASFAISGLRGKYAIGCFGRVRAQKGTDLFVEAMCRLLPKYPDFSAVVIGPVTAEHRAFDAKLKAQVEAAGLGERVKFLGELPIEDVPQWYKRILIYAFTSRNEGFGLTLLEAMASGNALVAARAGAADKVVTGGETGLLVPTDDADGLTLALDALMRDPLQAIEMGKRARERVVAEFSVDAEAGRIAAVYRQVLEPVERLKKANPVNR